jgi:phospholipid/cholesterol/gamma-HCH transport system ATP-binding protein
MKETAEKTRPDEMKAKFPIDIEGLHKSFGEQRVLQGLKLRLASGETVAVLGRSGSGKSVLLKLIIRLQRPDSGSIRVAGEDIGALEPRRLNEIRGKVGFLFQNAALYDSLTVEDNVAFPLRRHTRMQRAERGKRVRELLAEVGMEDAARKMPSQLSGGMQKRVGLARALALDPDILLLDEPTAGLDPITAAEIVELILALKKRDGVSAVVVTHDVHNAKAFSDRMLLLHEGRVRSEGTYDELRQSHDEFVQRFLGDNREETAR